MGPGRSRVGLAGRDRGGTGQPVHHLARPAADGGVLRVSLRQPGGPGPIRENPGHRRPALPWLGGKRKKNKIFTEERTNQQGGQDTNGHDSDSIVRYPYVFIPARATFRAGTAASGR